MYRYVFIIFLFLILDINKYMILRFNFLNSFKNLFTKFPNVFTKIYYLSKYLKSRY